MATNDDLRTEIKDLAAIVRDGFTAVRADIGGVRADFASHVTEDRLRLGALEQRQAALDGGLASDKSKDSDNSSLTARVRLPGPPGVAGLKAAAQWGAALALFGGPIVAIVGGLLGFAPDRVQAAVQAVEALTVPEVHRVDQALTVPAPEPVPLPASPVPSGPAPAPTDGPQ